MSREKLQTIAKILARATSPEEHEAKTAVEHAYKRMARDGLTLKDLLTLPEADLYQETLVRLVGVILEHQTDMSPSAKREAYAAYMRLIVDKFSGPGQGSAGASSSTGTRDEEARRYREQHGYQSQSSGAGFAAGSGQSQNTQSQSTASSTPGATPGEQKTTASALLAAVKEAAARSLEPGGFLWFIWHHPTLMLRLSGASLLWGMGFALVLMTVAAVLHVVTGTNPWIDVPLKPLFALLTAIGLAWRMQIFMKQR
jgi:Protein of unknown function (DUF2786)